jgi:hypothetical protein
VDEQRRLAMPTRLFSLFLVFTILFSCGCGGGDTGGDTPTNPQGIDPLSVSVLLIDFDYFENSGSFTIRNKGTSAFSWSAAANEDWVLMDPNSGSLNGGQTVTVSVSIARTSLSSGYHSARVIISTNASEDRMIDISVHHYDEDMSVLDFTIVDTEYDSNNDVWVVISQNPSELHVLDPDTKTYQSVPLSVTPQCVSIRPDGAYAAVGHDAWITPVNLASLQVDPSIQVTVDIGDIVLTQNNWAYAFPRSGGWENVRSIDLATGTETQDQQWDVHSGSTARLHPSGEYIYSADNGISPSDIDKYDIRSGTAVHLYDSPYHGDYPFAGNLWFSPDGSKIFSRSGNIFNATDDPQTDLIYAGALSDIERVTWAHFCDVSNKLYICRGIMWDDLTNEIRAYDGTFFQFQTAYLVPDLMMPNGAGGGVLAPVYAHYCAVNSSGTTLHVISRHNDADIWAVTSFDL